MYLTSSNIQKFIVGLAYFPLVINLITSLIAFPNINIFFMIGISLSLFLIPYYIITEQSKYAWIILALQTIVLAIVGYYDYIKWFSTIVGIALALYFWSIYYVRNYFKKKVF